jgi:hypothetical protein
MYETFRMLITIKLSKGRNFEIIFVGLSFIHRLTNATLLIFRWLHGYNRTVNIFVHCSTIYICFDLWIKCNSSGCLHILLRLTDLKHFKLR